MPKPIVHRDLLSVLSLELKQDARALRDSLFRDPGSLTNLMARIEKLDWSRLEFVLEEPITLSEDGVPLLAKGTHLTPSYVKALLGRQLQSRERSLGPVVLVPSETTVGHYRRKVSEYFDAVLARVKESGGAEVAQFHRAMELTAELSGIREYFGEIVDGVLTATDNISTILHVVSQRGNETVIERDTNAAFVAMGILAAYQRYGGEEERRRTLTAMGLAALFQDISLMVDHDQPMEGHPDASAAVAEEMGLDGAALCAIRDHHRTRDRFGDPLLQGESSVPLLTRVLVVTNVFLDMVSGSARLGGFEALKGLNHLAAGGYVDRRAVDVLSRLCLPRVKSYVIEQANRIASQCEALDGSPVLWPVTGDKIPAVFLCRSDTCPHVSMQASELARDVPFLLQGVPVATIPRGRYFTCTFLTPKLRELYDYLQSRARGADRS